MNFNGVIIEESLEDVSVLSEVKIVDTVEIPEEKAEEIARISSRFYPK